jgi:hypothetical protein
VVAVAVAVAVAVVVVVVVAVAVAVAVEIATAVRGSSWWTEFKNWTESTETCEAKCTCFGADGRGPEDATTASPSSVLRRDDARKF